jgi:hypothetical protein
MGLDHVTLMRGRNSNSLAIKSDGTVWVWGDDGRVAGDGTRGTDRTTPVLVLFPPFSDPSITSALIATGTVGKPFSYTITATGTLPITLGVAGLLAWASFNSSVISGTPDVTGTFPVTLTATNNVGSDNQTLTIFVGRVFSVYLPILTR